MGPDGPGRECVSPRPICSVVLQVLPCSRSCRRAGVCRVRAVRQGCCQCPRWSGGNGLGDQSPALWDLLSPRRSGKARPRGSACPTPGKPVKQVAGPEARRFYVAQPSGPLPVSLLPPSVDQVPEVTPQRNGGCWCHLSFPVDPYWPLRYLVTV